MGNRPAMRPAVQKELQAAPSSDLMNQGAALALCGFLEGQGVNCEAFRTALESGDPNQQTDAAVEVLNSFLWGSGGTSSNMVTAANGLPDILAIDKMIKNVSEARTNFSIEKMLKDMFGG
jgi:hypothetical protein